MNGVYSGVNDQRHSDTALAEAQQLLESCIDSLSSHIAVLDEDGVILGVNAAWRRFADDNGFNAGTYGVGSNYLDACQPAAGDCSDSIDAAAGLRDVLHGRKDEYELEYPCHSSAESRWFLLRVTRLNASGRARLVVSHENITKRKQAENAVKDASRRKDEFLAILAHELRNPLAPIRHAAKIIRFTDGDPQVLHSACEIMERQIGHMVRLVDDLLDVSRLSHGNIELRKEPVALASVINQAIEAASPNITAMEQRLTITLSPEPINVYGDPIRLAQAIGNLLNNACKYTDRDGCIYVSVNREDSDVVIRIRDTGIGISAEQLPLVFDMFTQLEGSPDGSQSGLGIGLTLVKNLVEMHGGSVSASSAGRGRGCEFVVRLPIHQQAVEVAVPTQAANDGASTSKRILVVDDNRDSANSLATFLQLFGNETHLAFDGKEAVEVAATVQPDVVLLDIGMPRMNGYDAARKIREQPWASRVVLVAVTGWGQNEDKRKAHDAGFNCHMVKPVDPAVITALLPSLSSENQVEYET